MSEEELARIFLEQGARAYDRALQIELKGKTSTPEQMQNAKDLLVPDILDAEFLEERD